MTRWQSVFVTAAVLCETAPAGAQIAVGPNVLVSSDAPDLPHFEMILSADREHPDRLIACSMVFLVPDRTRHEVATYVSSDRGRSWRRTLVVQAPNESREVWDPDCSFGPGGIAYSISESIDSAGRPYVQVDRSTDGGLTWGEPSRIKHFERLFITPSHATGPRHGWLFFHGQAGMRVTGGVRGFASGLGLHVSQDSGRTTLTNIVAAGENDYVIGTGPGVVLSDGTFVGIFEEFRDYWKPDGTSQLRENLFGRVGSARSNGRLKVVTIEPDSSAAYIAPTVHPVTDWFSAWPGWNKSALASLTADATDGPFKDRLYATWADVRSGRSEVYLSYSSNKGTTWSTPRRVSDDGPTPPGAKAVDHLHGTAAVNPQGVLGLCWYDRRDHPDNLSWTVRCTASHDGGDTFMPSVPVSKVPHRTSRADRMWMEIMERPPAKDGPATAKIGVHSFNFSGGHTVGLAADAAGGFHPLWTSNPGAVPQLWTARVTVAGQAAKNGGGALAELADTDGKVVPVLVNASYTPKPGRLEGELYLENTSKDTISGPMVLRILAVESELGTARLANADNRKTGPGAVYDFTALLPRGRLAPGERSASKPIKIDATLHEPIRPGLDAVGGVAMLISKVLAAPPPEPPPDAVSAALPSR